MEIRILEKEQQQSIYDQAYQLLAAADEEFVPPLSSRSSSTQRDFSATIQNSDGIRQYFAQLKMQRFAAVFEENALIAFVSYKENYTCAEISSEELPNIYISTLVVSPKARGKGVTKALYSIAARDARIGYEASNHYYFTQHTFLEKIINLYQLKTF